MEVVWDNTANTNSAFPVISQMDDGDCEADEVEDCLWIDTCSGAYVKISYGQAGIQVEINDTEGQTACSCFAFFEDQED